VSSQNCPFWESYKPENLSVNLIEIIGTAEISFLPELGKKEE
jgi:hypothetical protein